MTRVRLRAAVVLLTFGLAACGSSGGSGGSSAPAGTSSTNAAGGGKIVVADAGFTESKVLAAIYVDLLNKAGFSASDTSVQSSEIFQSSLESGQVAVVPEYVATYADQLNVIVNGKNAPSVASSDLEKTLAALKGLAAKRGLSILTPTKAVDQNAFAVSKSFAAQHKISTLSQLGALKLPVTIAAGPECATRPFCGPGLTKTYGINVKGIDKTGVDTLQTKKAVQSGRDQLGLVLTTDATVSDFDLVVLADDKGLQNADYLVPVVNTKKLTPALAAALNKLAPVLTTDDLAQLNKKVDSERETPAAVASDYLKEKGLI